MSPPVWFLTIGDRHPDTFYGQHVKTCGTSQAKRFSFRWLRAPSKADAPLVIYLREKKTYETFQWYFTVRILPAVALGHRYSGKGGL